MGQSPFIITFPGVTSAQANRYAADLAATLRELDRNLKVEQQRDQEDTQDFGATVAIILGTATAKLVAKGLAAWLARHRATIQINADGSVIATGLDGKDAARIAEAFNRRK